MKKEMSSLLTKLEAAVEQEHEVGLEIYDELECLIKLKKEYANRQRLVLDLFFELQHLINS
jgi:hypothetical protein